MNPDKLQVDNVSLSDPSRPLRLSQHRKVLLGLLLSVARRLAIAFLIALAIIFLTYLGLALARGSSLSSAFLRAVTQTPLYLLRLGQGDLGLTEAGSLTLVPVSVNQVLAETFGKSLGLLMAALLVAGTIGMGLGIIATRWRHSSRSLWILLASLVGVSLPSFFVAVLLQRFALTWRSVTGEMLVPVGGFGWDTHLVLPLLVLAARPIAQIARITFLSLSGVLAQDYVRTAHAKGLRPLTVFSQHSLRNSLIPILTTIAVSLRFSLSSLAVVELFFGWPGAGALLLKAFARQDDNLAIPLVLAFGLLFVLVNLLLEISYPLLDPRLQETQTHSHPSGRTPGILALLASIRDLLSFNRLRAWWRQRTAPPEPNPFRELLNKQRREGERDEAVKQLSWSERFGRQIKQWRRLFNLPLLMGGAIVGLLLVLYFVGPTLAPHNPYTINSLDFQDGIPRRPPFPPDATYPWGSDQMGRDMLSLILVGIQQTLLLALLVVGARLFIGGVLGMLAGWWRGSKLDRFILSTAEVIAPFPTLLLAMLIILALGIRQGLRPFIIALCVVGWGEMMQFVRSEVMAIRSQPWIESAVAVGASTPRIMLNHILPNLLPALISLIALEIGAVLMLLGELGFIGIFIGGGVFVEGLGHFSDVPEWGSLLATIRLYAQPYPWTALYPAMAFFVAILGFNLFGEGFRRLSDVADFSVTRLVNRYTLALALLAFLLVGWIQNNTGAVAVYERQSQAVEGEQALAYFQALTDPALEGRALGTAGVQTAADYIAEQFRVLGLQRAGEDLSYFQTRSRSYESLDAVPTFQIQDGGLPPVYADDYVAYPAPYRNLGQGTGKVRFLATGELTEGRLRGDAFSYPALQELEKTSQEVLLVLSEDDFFYAAHLPHQGILVVAEESTGWQQPRTLSPLTRSQAGFPDGEQEQPVLWISERTANRLLKSTGQTVAELRQQSDDLGQDEVMDLLTDVTVSLEVQGTVHEREPVVNVIGHLPGIRDDMDDRLIVVLAPYDTPPLVPGESIRPMAHDDSASGVAVMLAVIRALQASDYQPYRAFLFVAYSGEGLEGGNPMSDPQIETFLQARVGFAAAYQIEAVIQLNTLETGTESTLVVSTGGSLRLTELVEKSARRIGVAIRREEVPIDISIIYDEGARFRGDEDKYPTVRLYWQSQDTTADKLESTSKVLALTLMILGRESQY